MEWEAILAGEGVLLLKMLCLIGPPNERMNNNSPSTLPVIWRDGSYCPVGEMCFLLMDSNDRCHLSDWAPICWAAGIRACCMWKLDETLWAESGWFKIGPDIRQIPFTNWHFEEWLLWYQQTIFFVPEEQCILCGFAGVLKTYWCKELMHCWLKAVTFKIKPPPKEQYPQTKIKTFKLFPRKHWMDPKMT